MSSVILKRPTNDHPEVYVTASMNVGSINYEHAWYIYSVKMEGIVSVIVTMVDTASRSLLFDMCVKHQSCLRQFGNVLRCMVYLIIA